MIKRGRILTGAVIFVLILVIFLSNSHLIESKSNENGPENKNIGNSFITGQAISNFFSNIANFFFSSPSTEKIETNENHMGGMDKTDKIDLEKFNIKTQDNKYISLDGISDNDFNQEVDQEVVNVSECGVLDQPNTRYKLIRSLGNVRDCIDIQADNIYFDCDDWNVWGYEHGGGYGFRINGYDNFTLWDCNVGQFATGVLAENTTGLRIVYNAFEYNSIAIHVKDSSNAYITRSTLTDSGPAIRLESTDHSLITYNQIGPGLVSFSGIELLFSDYNELNTMNIEYTLNTALSLIMSNNNYVEYVYMGQNSHGVDLSDSNNNEFDDVRLLNFERDIESTSNFNVMNYFDNCRIFYLIDINGRGSIQVKNSTFEEEYVWVNSQCFAIFRKAWDVNVKTKYRREGMVVLLPNVLVKAYPFGSYYPLVEKTTDSLGSTGWFDLYEYIIDRNGKTLSNPYKIVLNKDGFTPIIDMKNITNKTVLSYNLIQDNSRITPSLSSR